MSSLWYTSPAHLWPEALPIGNGRLGAMVFGGVRRERLQLNEDTLYGGGPYNPSNPDARQHLSDIQRAIFGERYDEADALAQAHFLGRPKRQPAYQTVGDLYIELDGVPEVIPQQYQRELSLDTAEVSVEYQYDGDTYGRRYLASPVHQVIAVRYTASRAGALNLNIFATSPHARTSVSSDDDSSFLLQGRNTPEVGLQGVLRFAVRCAATTVDGSVRYSDDQLQIRDATEATILIAIATSFKTYADVSADPVALTQEHIGGCINTAYAQIAEASIASHSALFRRVSLDLGQTQQAQKPTNERLIDFAAGRDDPGLVALYFQYGRYLLIASSRPGSQPANLQGIWNDSLDPGWGCGFTVNINTQMNYWPAEATALPETVDPLVNLIRGLSETGAVTAREMYGARGWVCHQNTDVWRATSTNTGARWSCWPVGGAWLCRHLWDRYDYSRDIDYLRTVYPILAGASLFFVDTMVQDPVSGYMVTVPSNSPENIHGIGGSDTTLCAGPTMDMQILRDLFYQTIKAAGLLDVDHAFAAELEVLRRRLRPTTIRNDGRINEWPDHLQPTEPERNHRHTSHLYGLFPSNQISPDTPDLAKASITTLDSRGRAETGWAAAWRLNLFARLREPQRAWDMLRLLLSDLTYPNMFDVHPPLSKAYSLGTFQIDGNLGGAAGICELLVQSPADSDDILLLPALPRELNSGRITGIRTRGRWQVDLVWDRGDVVRVTLRAEMNASKRIRCKGSSTMITLQAGEEATLFGPELSP